MTDAEIIKALECCKVARLNQDCLNLNCPFATEYGCNIDDEGLRNVALDLITRQSAEIEKYAETARAVALWLKGFCDRQATSYLDMIADAARKAGAEIERLKEKNAPAADVVPRGVFDQVKWERDQAIQQLKELGVSLGTVAPDDYCSAGEKKDGQALDWGDEDD